MGQAIKQLKEGGYENNFITSLGFILSTDAHKIAGNALYNGYYLNFTFTRDTSYYSFYKHYMEQYKKEPTPNSVIDYNSFYIILTIFLIGIIQVTGLDYISILGARPDFLLVCVIFFVLYFGKSTGIKAASLAG